MNIHVIGTIAASASPAPTAAYNIPLNNPNNMNKNNIGVFSVAPTGTTGGTGTFTVQGSTTGGTGNYEWVDLATGVAMTVGTTTVGGSGAKTIALMPYIRFLATTAPTVAVTGYISQ